MEGLATKLRKKTAAISQETQEGEEWSKLEILFPDQSMFLIAVTET